MHSLAFLFAATQECVINLCDILRFQFFLKACIDYFMLYKKLAT